MVDAGSVIVLDGIVKVPIVGINLLTTKYVFINPASYEIDAGWDAVIIHVPTPTAVRVSPDTVIIEVFELSYENVLVFLDDGGEMVNAFSSVFLVTTKFVILGPVLL